MNGGIEEEVHHDSRVHLSYTVYAYRFPGFRVSSGFRKRSRTRGNVIGVEARIPCPLDEIQVEQLDRRPFLPSSPRKSIRGSIVRLEMLLNYT